MYHTYGNPRRSLELALASVALMFSAGCHAVAGKLLLPREAVRPAEFAVTAERVPMITSDGVTLVADVHHPKGLQKTPTILVRIPFSNTLANRVAAEVVGRFWARRGYTVVIQGTRGRYRSSGAYYPLRGERRDGIETLQWLARQPWFDGRIGMWGGSAFGYTQWVLADQIDPGPSAFILQISSSSAYEMFYPGGAFSLESALFWALRSRDKTEAMPSIATLERGVKGFPLVQADDRAIGDIPFFNDWVSHPERDAYWAEIDGTDRAASLHAPALLMAGWFDPYLPSQLRDFARIRSVVGSRAAAEARLIIGPWSHARTVKLPGAVDVPSYRRASLAPSLAWFDRHLGSLARPASMAPVRIYVMGDNVWRDEEEWPLARTQFRSYYLRSLGRANTATGDGTLSLEPALSNEPADTYTYDPTHPVPSAGGAMIGPRAGVTLQNHVEARPDVLVYTTPPLGADLEVTGPVSLVLYVRTSAPHTDFTGKLVDVHPDGRAYNVSDGITRRQFRESAAAGSAPPSEVRVELWPTSTVFKKGHRIRLEVSSSNFPRFDRNPNTGRAIATELHPTSSTQTVFHDARRPSRLELPVIPR